MKAGKVAIVEIEKARPKRQKQTDFFLRLLSNPTDTLCCVARTKHPVRRPKKPPLAGSVCTANCPSHDENKLCILATCTCVCIGWLHVLCTSIVSRLVDNLYLDVTYICIRHLGFLAAILRFILQLFQRER